MTLYTILKTSTVGELLLVADGTHLTGVYFLDCKHAPPRQPHWRADAAAAVLKLAGKELTDFLNGGARNFSVLINGAGTAFQKEVWRQIALIPFGQTISYTELARRAGAPEAVRAAGTATGRNPLSIIVPCHRVVGKGGSLCGYAGGLERKRRLLEMENPGNGWKYPKNGDMLPITRSAADW